MAVQFRLAALGHTMEKGRLLEWFVAEGYCDAKTSRRIEERGTLREVLRDYQSASSATTSVRP